MTAPRREPLTVVMYHYVRPIASSAYPGIKGLEVDAFERQLDYLARHHSFVSAADVIDSARGGAPLPARPVLLTFDDGYADHRRHVFPSLVRRGLRGAFFPPSRAIRERRLLDVNKIHFILASGCDPDQLVRSIEAEIESREGAGAAASLRSYRSSFLVANRFDPPAVNYVKRMLQRGLPVDVRHEIVDALFARHVSGDARAFADDLYVSVADLGEMAEAGMGIGSHGHEHYWLDSLDAAAQQADIERSLALLDDVGVSRRDFLFCYPYGAYDSNTLVILAGHGCGAAFTTRVGLADVDAAALLTVPRLDTNDLPRDAAAERSEWTALAHGDA